MKTFMPRLDPARSMGLRLSLLALVVLAPLFSAGAGARTVAEEHSCLALSIYWEARGEQRAGMYAVGWVVLNRVASREFPATLCDVVRQGGERPPCQFSWWCDGKSDRPRDRASWTTAQLIAATLLSKPPPDPTKGALFFHSVDVRVPWRKARNKTAEIGRHVFYR